MRPLNQYLDFDKVSKPKYMNKTKIVSNFGPQDTIINPKMTVKGGGGGLITEKERRSKTLKLKGKWISPFVHKRDCQANKRKNLKQNQSKNMEKSALVNHNLSLHHTSNPDKLYNLFKSHA